jgi:hypothetical protein
MFPHFEHQNCKPVRPTEGYSLLEQFTSFGVDSCNKRIPAWNFSAYQQFLASHGSVMHAN